MKTLFFRKLLRSLERRTPDIIASVEIQILLDTTARAFGVKGKRVWNHRRLCIAKAISRKKNIV